MERSIRRRRNAACRDDTASEVWFLNQRQKFSFETLVARGPRLKFGQ